MFEYGNREFKNAGDAVFGSLALARAIQVSSDVFFYQLGAALNAKGAVLQEWARRLSFGKPTGIDIPGEFGGLVPDAKWRNSEYDKYRRCAKKAKVPEGTTEALYACGGIERGWSGGDNVNLAVGQGDLQATPLQLATAYAAIANGGRVVTPHLGQQVEDTGGRQLEEIRKPAKRARRLRPCHAGHHPRRAAGRGGRGGRHVGRRVRRLPVHRVRQDGHRRARAEPRPVLVRVLRRRPGQADRRRRDRREGRLRRRGGSPGGAPDPVQVVRRQGLRVPRRDECNKMISFQRLPRRYPTTRRVSSGTPIQPASEPPPSLAPREWRLRLDPLLLLAVLGLVACSLVALKGATAGDVDGQPYYYVYRQAVYAGVGLVLMYALSRMDYTRLQELRYAVYGALLAMLLVVLAVATATRGAKAWIDIPFFGAFQPSEFGKVLLVVALAGFLVSRMRLMGARRPRGSSCSG